MNIANNFTTIHFIGSCNFLNELSTTVCVPIKTEDLNLTVFSIITEINESKPLTKHLSCECKCRFDAKKCSSNQWWNKNKCQYECNKRHLCENDFAWNPGTCSCENGKYLASIIDDSAINCHDAKWNDKGKSYDRTNFNENKVTCKTQNSYISLAFSLITIALVIDVSNYCYLIKENKHIYYDFTS